MALFSSNKSSSTTQNTSTTEIQDRRIGAGDGALVAAEGSSIVIQNLDKDVAQSAINASASIAGKATEEVSDVAKLAIDTSADTFKRTIAFAEDSNAGSQALVSKTTSTLADQTDKNRNFLENTFEKVAQSELTQEERQSQRLFMLGVVFLLTLGSIFIARELKK